MVVRTVGDGGHRGGDPSVGGGGGPPGGGGGGLPGGGGPFGGGGFSGRGSPRGGNGGGGAPSPPLPYTTAAQFLAMWDNTPTDVEQQNLEQTRYFQRHVGGLAYRHGGVQSAPADDNRHYGWSSGWSNDCSVNGKCQCSQCLDRGACGR
jgi:hypothetical protein